MSSGVTSMNLVKYLMLKCTGCCQAASVDAQHYSRHRDHYFKSLVLEPLMTVARSALLPLLTVSIERHRL